MASKEHRAVIPGSIGNGVPLTWTAEAEEFLSRLPAKAIGRVLSALDKWLKEVPLAAARADVFTDPEDIIESREVIVELIVRAKDDRLLALWEEMGAVLDASLESLPASQVEKLDRFLGIHVVPITSVSDFEPAAQV